MPAERSERSLFQQKPEIIGVKVTPHLQEVSDLRLRTEFAAQAGVGDITGESLDTHHPMLGGYNKTDVFPESNESDLEHTTHQ